MTKNIVVFSDGTGQEGGKGTNSNVAAGHCPRIGRSRPSSRSFDREVFFGEGSMGPPPFRNAMRDPRFHEILKVIETPKGDDPVRTDRRMLRRLRAYGRPTTRP